MDAEQIVKDAIATNPDVRLVLEMAARAREAESKEPPRSIGMSTEVAALPTTSQYPVLLGTPR